LSVIIYDRNFDFDFLRVIQERVAVAVAVAVARRQFEGEHLPLKTATRRLVKTVS
jgi:hypothetical protein